MIGLSVSFCIRDIVEGRVKLEDVEKIVGRTSFSTPAEMEGVIKKYREIYWRKDADKSEQLFRHLLREGKIEQPILSKGVHPMTINGYWVASEDQIRWSEFTHQAPSAEERQNIRENFKAAGIKMLDSVDNRRRN